MQKLAEILFGTAFYGAAADSLRLDWPWIVYLLAVVLIFAGLYMFHVLSGLASAAGKSFIWTWLIRSTLVVTPAICNTASFD